MSVPFYAIIPSRMKSTRLPDKPLKDIAGRPMVVRVAERAAQSGAADVVVATDHEAIFQACERFGVKSIMTSPEHPTGTDRLAETVEKMGLPDEAIVVNVQGDEPLIPPEIVSEVADLLASHPECGIATAAGRRLSASRRSVGSRAAGLQITEYPWESTSSSASSSSYRSFSV